MTERRDRSHEDEILRLEEEFSADVDIYGATARVGVEIADDPDIADSSSEPYADPVEPIPRYDTGKVPHVRLTDKQRIDEARVGLRRIEDERTAKLLSPEALRVRLGAENLQRFVIEVVKSLQTGKRIDEDVITAMLDYANDRARLESAAKIPGVDELRILPVEITRGTLETLEKGIRDWAEESIQLHLEAAEQKKRQRQNPKWYKRTGTWKAVGIMGAAAATPLLLPLALPASLAAAGWVSWTGLGIVGVTRLGGGAAYEFRRSRAEKKERKELLTEIEKDEVSKARLTQEALSCVSATMREDAEKNPEKEALERARAKYANRIAKDLPAMGEKDEYEQAFERHFQTRRERILEYLEVVPGTDLDHPDNEELKEYVDAMTALAKADERNRLVEAQANALVGDGESFSKMGKVVERVGGVLTAVGAARRDYRMGYAIAITTGAVLARATKLRQVWGAAVGVLAGSTLGETFASRFIKESGPVIDERNLRLSIDAVKRQKTEATSMLSSTALVTTDELDVMISKVRGVVDSASVDTALGARLSDPKIQPYLYELRQEQAELQDILVALQSMQNVFAFNTIDISSNAKDLAKQRRESVQSQKRRKLAGQIGGAIAGGTLGFFAPDLFKKGIAWAQDHMPGVDHAPDVVPATTPATTAPDTDPAATTTMKVGAAAPGAADPVADPRSLPFPGATSGAPDVHAAADVASTAAGTGTSPEVLQDAVVHRSEGIQHALIRQLIDSPTEHGYDGDPNDAAAVKEWAGHEAHLRCLDPRNAYVAENSETRVRIPDKYAYVLNSDGTVTEYEVTPSGAGDFEVVRPSGSATTLDTYEYKVPLGTHETVHVPHADVHTDIHAAAPDADVAAEPHGTIDTSAATAGVKPDHKALDALLSSLHTAQDSGDPSAVTQAQAAVVDFGHDHPDTVFDSATQVTTEVGDAVQSESIRQLNEMLPEGSGSIENPREFRDALVDVFRTIMSHADAEKLAYTIGETDPGTGEVHLNASDVSPLLNADDTGFDIRQFQHMKDAFYAELNEHSLPKDAEWHPRHPMGLTSTADLSDRTDEVWLVRREPGSAGTYEVFNASLEHARGVDHANMEQWLNRWEDLPPVLPESNFSPDIVGEAPESSADADVEPSVIASAPAETPAPIVSSEPISGDTSREAVLNASDDSDAPSANETPTADAEASDATPKSEYADLFARPSTEIPDKIHLSIDDDARAYMQEHDIKIDAESGKFVLKEGTQGVGHEIIVPGENALRFEMVNGRLYAIAESNDYYFAQYIHENAVVEPIGNGNMSELDQFPEKEAAHHERERVALAHDREEAAKATTAPAQTPPEVQSSIGISPEAAQKINSILSDLKPGLTLEAIHDAKDPEQLAIIQETLQEVVNKLHDQGTDDARGLAAFFQNELDSVNDRLEASALRLAA